MEAVHEGHGEAKAIEEEEVDHAAAPEDLLEGDRPHEGRDDERKEAHGGEEASSGKAVAHGEKSEGHRENILTAAYTDDGKAVPVTVLDVANNRVTQIKTPESDGYAAVQVTYGKRRANRVNKAQAGHLAKAGVEAGVEAGTDVVDAATDAPDPEDEPPQMR